jgi:transcriptional regulator of stress and heat shock response
VGNLATRIEDYLLRLLSAAPRQFIDLQRKELAERFECVPSQINYVLETRFTLERGFLVESRRGGGGYLRIARLRLDRNGPVFDAICHGIGDSITQKRAEDLLNLLEEERVITAREAALLKAAVKKEYYPPKKEIRDGLRAGFLRDAFREILKNS